MFHKLILNNFTSFLLFKLYTLRNVNSCYTITENQIRVVWATNSIIRSIQCFTWAPFLIYENMSEHMSVSATENKLNELNKKIVEIKKKIQLSGNCSNRIKHPFLIYTVPDNPPWIQCCKTALQQSCRVRSYAYIGCATSTFYLLGTEVLLTA